MKRRCRIVVPFLVSFVSAAAVFAGERVGIKGYYREDGSYVKERAVDPIPFEDTAYPPLVDSLKTRRRQIEDYYRGRVVKSLISFPACRKGVVIRLDRPREANVDLFRAIHAHGVSIEKGAAAVITGFRVRGRVMDVDLNGGGYGTAWDVTTRTAAGIGTLGLSELAGDHAGPRLQRGSRLRIISKKKLGVEDLNFKTIEARLSLALERP